jgi:hypothetical protein
MDNLKKEMLIKTKSRATEGSSFGSSAMLKPVQHPLLSVFSSQRVWLFRESYIMS